MIDNLKPVFNINNKNIKLIKKIEEKLEQIKIDNNKKDYNLKLKSKVRSIYSSLAIEANSLSFEAVSNIIDNKIVLGEKKEIQEVKNANKLYENIDKYNWGKEEDLINAHMVLMRYFEDDNGGYRNHGEGIKSGNKIIFTAPESTMVPLLMKSLFKFLNDNKTQIHPIILAAIFHYYFVYIHPFTDGNGRIARFWVSLILKYYNPKFEYIPVEEQIYLNQSEYYDSIQQCHINGNANVFIDFLVKTIYQCLEKTTQETTQKEYNIKLNKNQTKIIDLINKKTNITRKEMAEYLNITSDGVKYNLNKLVKNNIIKRVGSNKGGYWKVNI